MNKELTLLETFELLCRSYVDDLNTLRHKDIEKDYFYNEKYGVTITDIKTGRSGKTADIETALTDYIVYKQDYERVMKEKNSLLKEYAKSQKEHKALEIIKCSGFSLEFDESQNEWFLHISARGTGIKTHDLLKEVLL